MSKYMHLTVTVLPYYQKDLEGTYPKLAPYLKTLKSDLVDPNPSLYAIAGKLISFFMPAMVRHSERCFFSGIEKIFGPFIRVLKRI